MAAMSRPVCMAENGELIAELVATENASRPRRILEAIEARYIFWTLKGSNGTEDVKIRFWNQEGLRGAD